MNPLILWLRRGWFGALLVCSISGELFGQRWHMGTSPHFEVLSGASEKETRRLLIELERFRANVLGVFPLGEAQEPKVRVYLFPSRRAFRPYMPTHEGKPKEVAGYFIGGPDEVIVALQPEKEASEHEDPVELIYHEYFHLLTHTRGLEFPLWLEEGLAEVFSTLRVDGKHAEIGAPKELYAFVLSETSMLPTEQLLGVDRSSPLYNEELRGSLFYAQAWAFTHYLLCGTDKGNLENLAAYIERLRTPGVHAQRAFREIFGDDMRKFDFALRQYLDGGRYRLRRLPARPFDESTVAVRPATDFERDVALANLEFRVHQNVGVTSRLLQLQATQPDSARPFEVLGAIAAFENDHDRARDYYRSATERASDNPFIYATMVRDAMRLFDRNDFDQRLSATDAFDVQRWIDRALALRPQDAELIELLAEVEARSPTIRVHAVNRVQNAIPILPRRDPTLLALATIRWRSGDAATAGQIVNAILASTESESGVKEAARLLRFRLGGDGASSATDTPAPGGARTRTLRETSETLKSGNSPIGETRSFAEEILGQEPTR